MEFNLRNVQVLSENRCGRKGRTSPVLFFFFFIRLSSLHDNLSNVSNKIDNRPVVVSWYRPPCTRRPCMCVCVSKRVSAKSALSSRIYRGRKKPVALVVNPHQSGDSRAMLATANSGKTFHSEIRLIQPRGPRLVNFSHRFPLPPFFFRNPDRGPSSSSSSLPL